MFENPGYFIWKEFQCDEPVKPDVFSLIDHAPLPRFSTMR